MPNVMENFAFPGNIDFAADDPTHFYVLSMKGSCVFFHEYSSMQQCLQSVNHKHNKWLEIPDF